MPKRRRSSFRRRRTFRRRPSRRSSYRKRGFRSSRRWSNRVWKAVIRKAETKWVQNYDDGAFANWQDSLANDTPTAYLQLQYPLAPSLVTVGATVNNRVGNRIQITAVEWKIHFYWSTPTWTVMNTPDVGPPVVPPSPQERPTRVRMMQVVPRDGTVTSLEMFPATATPGSIQPWNQPLQQDFYKLFKDRMITMSNTLFVTDGTPTSINYLKGKNDVWLRIRKRFKNTIYAYEPGTNNLVKPTQSLWFFQDLLPTVDSLNPDGQYLQFQVVQRVWFKDV